jgi:N-acetyltransferase
MPSGSEPWGAARCASIAPAVVSLLTDDVEVCAPNVHFQRLPRFAVMSLVTHTEIVTHDAPVLIGKHIRLEPLSHTHSDALIAASSGDPELYQWSAVPIGRDAVTQYIETALALREAGTALTFAHVRIADGAVLGSTRFFDMERWPWPASHPRRGSQNPDVCEIGYTWLTHSAVRTAANTEAKLLMLTHAFEAWNVLRVCLHTDARNQRSQAAIERIGGKFEGVLRAHRMAADFVPRDSWRYSIVAAEWPAAKQKFMSLLERA